MRSFPLVVLGFLVLVASCFSQQRNEGIASDAANRQSPKQLLLEVLQTDSGVGGTNQFVYLRIFSDRSVEFHPKRNQELKRESVSRAHISEGDFDATVKVLARDDVAELSQNFRSTYTPIDFYWTLDFTIPRGTRNQKTRVVNFYPSMAEQNNKPYPEALMRLVCTAWAIGQEFPTEMPDLSGDCHQFALKECHQAFSTTHRSVCILRSTPD
ncbi:MAG TPA: hypothetical protein VNX66_14720 [Candidatus Sulfotelmatobacter sp.]|jgi:hypothetical protein|nr:hypothetical protein [Candidatus Sulfotelmatobacter sp.]